MWTRLVGLFARPASPLHRQIDALDGLRGLAVLLVVASHTSNVKLPLLPGLDMQGTGRYGVYLFFVLSAFLLTRPLIAGPVERLRDPRLWARYALRRVFRIFPLYITVLTVNWLATKDGTGRAFTQMDTDSFVQHLLLREGIGLYWTIPVEFQYYLVLPFMGVLYATVLRERAVAATIATGAGIALAMLLWPADRLPTSTLQLGVYLPLFLCGSYAAFVDTRLEARRKAGHEPGESARTAAELAAFACLIALTALVPAVWNAATGSTVAKSHFHRENLLFGVLWSGVVLGTLNGRGWLERAFRWRTLRVIGVISFSVYLWHLPIARALYLELDLPPLPLAWMMFLLALLASAVSYVAIERPFTRLAWLERGIGAAAAGAGRAKGEPRGS